jgi:hypothetical protein
MIRSSVNLLRFISGPSPVSGIQLLVEEKQAVTSPRPPVTSPFQTRPDEYAPAERTISKPGFQHPRAVQDRRVI